MHITDPAAFPIAKNATYQPHAALLSDALANASKLAVPNLVLVQPSTYGTDNSCLLHHLHQINALQGHAARGVVVIDHFASDGGVSDETLHRWHALGVRGVRINLKSVGAKMDDQQLRMLLRRYAKRLRQAGGGVQGWAVQVFTDLADVGHLEEFVKEFVGNGRKGAEGGIKLVIDHLGSPTSIMKKLDDMPGWDAMRRLMRHPGVFVKVSGHYRTKGFDGRRPAKLEEFERLVKELLAARGGDGCVFASDWPHTRFEGWDIVPWVRACAEWSGTEEIREKLFRGNAKVLWDVD